MFHYPRNLHLVLGALMVLPLLAGGCREDAPDDIIGSEESTDALVFVKTTAEETLNRSWAEGNLYKLHPIAPDGEVTPITSFTGASISDPCVSFDGQRILFSMRAPGESNRNIYEIWADGTNLTRITDGGGHDFDPLYLPDGNILFTSSRDREMDEYNHSPAEHLYVCRADGSGIQRLSFNQSDDFDPALLPNGRIVYTRWDHFGTFNRFPLFVTNPDGSGTFHMFGPHNRNFFHAQPTPDGRLIAIESTMINEDAGPIAVLKLEQGPADPALGSNDLHWDVLTVNINTDGEPWPYGAFKYPHPLGRHPVRGFLHPARGHRGRRGLRSLHLHLEPERGGYGQRSRHPQPRGHDFSLQRPGHQRVRRPASRPPGQTSGDPLHRGRHPGLGDLPGPGRVQPGERRSGGTRCGVRTPSTPSQSYAARPTVVGERNDFSANEFEKRALIGFAPVNSDGSFKIRVPADTPIAFATLDDLSRGFVNKRTWIYVRPGETFTCFGCHEDRAPGGPVPTNPSPMAEAQAAVDLNIDPSQFQVINFRDDIAPIIETNCVTCHFPTFTAQGDTIPAPGGTWISAWIRIRATWT